MKKNKSKHSLKFEAISEMPPLHHKLPGQEFDWSKSEVMNWIVSQPQVRDYIYCKAANAGLIEYNNATGKWTGRDYV
jgi:hypothetical protein